jgi:hypothetical protein
LLSKSVKNSFGGWNKGKNKGKTTTKSKAIEQSFRLRLHSGLRQSGNAFGVGFNARTKVRAYPKGNGNDKSKRNGKARATATAKCRGLSVAAAKGAVSGRDDGF